jgi:hypothetical protein
MTRSPDSLVPSGSGQPEPEKRTTKPSPVRKGGETNVWAATPLQHRHIHQRSRRLSWSSSRGEPVPLEEKPDMHRNPARRNSVHRDGVEGGSTQRPRISTTGETRFRPAEATPPGREAYKGETRKRSNDAEQVISIL